MTIKQLNRDDLTNRYVSHTFTETTIGSMTLVEFKDGSSNVIGAAQTLVVDDAYRRIRQDLIGDATILITITEVQRDALTSPETGTLIYNTDATVEVYSGSAWDPA